MRHLFFATAITLASTVSVSAGDAALIIGIEDYDALNDLRRGDEIADQAGTLQRQGFDVFSDTAPEQDDLFDTLSAFEDAASDAVVPLPTMQGCQQACHDGKKAFDALGTTCTRCHTQGGK